MVITELLAPAGNFSTGIYALKAGANAVYLGLKEFSARSSADNFNLDELHRFRTAADEHTAKIYLALNTLIKQNEYPSALSQVEQALNAGINAVIVQDVGLANGIRKEFPSLTIHASTQMALHNADGLYFAKESGFTRVVLSRELRISEIEKLAPLAHDLGLELEVFIHGAYCYGFSGLCLASSALTGRSGNRGECAQICRSYFDSQKGRGYYFSANDIDATELLPRLVTAQVSSLKIEGRIKSEAYVYHTVKHYRELLDSGTMGTEYTGSPAEDSEYNGSPAEDSNLEKSLSEFSRDNSPMALTPPSPDTPQIGIVFPGHRGIPGAILQERVGDNFRASSLRPLHIRDRLSWISEKVPAIPVMFSVQKVQGQSLLLSIPEQGSVPPPGTTLNLTRRSDSFFKPLSPSSWQPKAEVIPVQARVSREGLLIFTETGTELASLDREPQEARTKKAFPEILEALLSQNDRGQSLFQLQAFTNDSGLPDDGLFFPPATLKQWKNQAYDSFLRLRENDSVPFSPVLPPKVLRPLPDRQDIQYGNFPFVFEAESFNPQSWPLINGYKYLCLCPVLFDPQPYWQKIEKALQGQTDIRIGLNNPGHLHWAQKACVPPGTTFFLDYGIYLANWGTYEAAKQLVPALDGAYLWAEADKQTEKTLVLGAPEGLKKAEGNLPLFIGRICHKRAVNGHQCPEDCDKKFDDVLTQEKQKFRVLVSDCLSFVFPYRDTSGPKR